MSRPTNGEGADLLHKRTESPKVESNAELNLKALCTMMHQIKSWIRATYSWASNFSID